jgi:hypothetical protein
MAGIIDAVIGIVASIFIIAIGVILMTALYPISPFMAVLGVLLLVAMAIALVVGFIRSQIGD